MTSATAAHTASLALSLLHHSSPPSQSFVLSPFSLNTALAIVHDGANGKTQEELTNLLINGCPSDVTTFYSSLTRTLSAPPPLFSPAGTGVRFKTANRFYLDDSVTLHGDYQQHIAATYGVKVLNLNLSQKEAAADTMSAFVDEATNSKIRDMVGVADIPDHAKAFLINAVHCIGKWKIPFFPQRTEQAAFKGHAGDRMIDFMSQSNIFPVNQENELGTVLIMPYEDKAYSFFYLMPKEDSNLAELRAKITGDKLLTVLKEAKKANVEINVPKFKIESEVDAAKILPGLGVKSLFSNSDLSKISPTPFVIGKIKHKAMILTDETGTEAAASTVVQMLFGSCLSFPPKVVIDRPFIFGIMRNDDILFIGQFV